MGSYTRTGRRDKGYQKQQRASSSWRGRMGLSSCFFVSAIHHSTTLGNKEDRSERGEALPRVKRADITSCIIYSKTMVGPFPGRYLRWCLYCVCLPPAFWSFPPAHSALCQTAAASHSERWKQDDKTHRVEKTSLKTMTGVYLVCSQQQNSQRTWKAEIY